MYREFIAGEWVEGARARRNINPSDTRDVIGEFAQTDRQQTRAAVAAARDAFRGWSTSSPQQRFGALDASGTEMLARRNELGDLPAREEGKTLPEAIGEVVRAGNIFKFFAGEALRTVSVIRVRDYDEALVVANETDFGFTAGIATTSLKHAAHFRCNAQVGMVMVNLPTAGVDYHVPFGGRKGSSYGPREQGHCTAEFHRTVRTVHSLP